MSVPASAKAHFVEFRRAVDDQSIVLGNFPKLHSPEETDLLHMIYEALMQAAPGEGSEVGTAA